MPEFKIFYSWQSDLPGNKTTRFIDECLSGVCAELNGVAEIKPDRATQGRTGSPDIAESIFTKIDNCDLFIADLSIINNFPEIDEAGNPTGNAKKTPNPNVLLETVYAAKVLGWDKIICLYNSEYGNPNDYPFDIAHRRMTGFHFTQSTKEAECNRIKRIIAQTVVTFLFAGGVQREGRAHYKIGGYDFVENKVIDTITPYSIRQGKYYMDEMQLGISKCKQLVCDIRNIHILKSTESKNICDDSADPMERLRIVFGGGFVPKVILDDEKEDIKNGVKEYLHEDISEDFFTLGNLKVKTTLIDYSTEYEGTEDEKKKCELIEELESELLHLQFMETYVKTFDDYVLVPLAIKNDSNELDANIQISISVENEAVECVSPEKNLIYSEIIGGEGSVYERGFVEHFLKMNENSNIRYDDNAFYTPVIATQFRPLTVTGMGLQQQPPNEDDYERELKIYIKEPIDGKQYQFEISSLRANETIWMGPIIILKPKRDFSETKLTYAIISDRTNGDLRGTIKICLPTS